MEQLPADVWRQVIDGDARIYNALVRTAKFFSENADFRRLKELLTSTTTILIGGEQIEVPITSGLIHTVGRPTVHLSSSLDGGLILYASYGKLIRGYYESLWYKGPNYYMYIFAENGSLSRNSGPAMYWAGLTEDITRRFAIYANAGVISRITLETSAIIPRTNLRSLLVIFIDTLSHEVRINGSLDTRADRSCINQPDGGTLYDSLYASGGHRHLPPRMLLSVLTLVNDCCANVRNVDISASTIFTTIWKTYF